MPPFDKLAELAAQLSSIYASVAKQHQLTLNDINSQNFLHNFTKYFA